MKKIFCLILLICVVLSLYSFIFLGSSSVNFQEAYISTLSFITDIGSIFEPLKNIPEYARYAVSFIQTMFDFGVTTVQNVINVIADLPGTISGFITEAVSDLGEFFINLGNRISDFFTTLGDRISGFFTNIFDNIRDFFGGGSGYDEPIGPCQYCGDPIDSCDCSDLCDECGKINALCNCNSTTNPINPPGSGETIEPYSIN